VRLTIDDPSLFDTLIDILEKLGIAIIPCDTIYGIVGIAPESEKKIKELKGREEKSFLRLIPSSDWLSRFTDCALPSQLERFWPGPLTIIFPAKVEQNKSVALRIPDDPLLLRLMKRLAKPLFSTSVNISGQPALWRIRDILEIFEDKVDLVVDVGDRAEAVPSTIIDITEKPYKILRQGAVELPRKIYES
jgi:L-threonylcarbamoyladenylate synthase